MLLQSARKVFADDFRIGLRRIREEVDDAVIEGNPAKVVLTQANTSSPNSSTNTTTDENEPNLVNDFEETDEDEEDDDNEPGVEFLYYFLMRTLATYIPQIKNPKDKEKVEEVKPNAIHMLIY